MLALRTGNEADYIHPADPALDSEAPGFAEAYKEFFETGDRSALPLCTGARPSVFKVRRMHVKAFEHCMRQASEVDRYREAVCYGLVSVENVEVEGKPLTLQTERGDLGLDRLTDACLAKFYAWDLIQPLAIRILNFQTLPPSKRQQ